MKALLSLIPLNLIPALMVLAQGFGMIHLSHFTFLLSAVVIFTLSLEMIKSAAFALSGSASWIDFIMSLLLLLAILGYMIYLYLTKGGVAPREWWLVAEAQLMDVVAGFYITVTNARRDIGVEH